MPASPKAIDKAALPRKTALPEMAPAVVILDETRAIEYVNASAAMLFNRVDPVGYTLPALFSTCETEGGDAIFSTFDAGGEPADVRLRLNDGRSLDCTLRALSSGGFVMSLDDVTTLVKHADLAKRDALTGLANRVTLRERLIERIANGGRAGQSVAVFYIDLDRFKAVNDTLGHPVGDALLRKVAERIKSASRAGDVVARLGGDEFAVIQSEVPQPAAAAALATRLVDLISRAYVLDGHMLHIGASIGVALFPNDGLEPDLLLKNADLALYRAKADGRGVYRFFETGMDDRLQARRAMELDLRRALALKEFFLVYQPQIALDTDAIVGFEALVRWRHPERGVVSPGDFLPLAEEIGVSAPLDEWVMRTACKQAASWPETISIAVNVAPAQFRSGKLVDTVTSVLAASGLPARRLDLELTEGALLEPSESLLKDMERLRDMGVRLSMDDFGTGYSSLSYLQRYPFDKIKIDRSFIHDSPCPDTTAPIVRAITGMAAALRMTTLAEGVETDAELSLLRAEGCEQVQGYLTGRPVSAEEATAMINQMIEPRCLEGAAA